jgi:hypothetical protein
VWQWRWMNSKTNSLLELTGRAVKNRMAMLHVSWKKTPRTFSGTKFPVKLQVIIKKTLQIPEKC